MGYPPMKSSLAEDELARLTSVGVELERLFAKRPDEGPFAADFDEWLLQLGEFTATNRTVLIAALRATPVADTAGIDSARLTDIVARIPATAERLQYVNPNVREDAYNKGVRDLAEAIAAALRTPKPEGERP